MQVHVIKWNLWEKGFIIEMGLEMGRPNGLDPNT